MSESNSYLVSYTLREVGPGCWPYPADAHWAEVDLAAAARAMREVFDDPGAARERGARAAARGGGARGAPVRAESPWGGAGGRPRRPGLTTILAGREIEPYLPLP